MPASNLAARAGLSVAWTLVHVDGSPGKPAGFYFDLADQVCVGLTRDLKSTLPGAATHSANGALVQFFTADSPTTQSTSVTTAFTLV